jgi:hypothetical protein
MKNKTRIVNVKDSRYDFYIGRPNEEIFQDLPGSDGIFEKPFKIGKHATREEVIEKYKIHFYYWNKVDKVFKALWKDWPEKFWAVGVSLLPVT